jgi:acetyl-CoA carboxylase biotin carboxyl carrier protein
MTYPLPRAVSNGFDEHEYGLTEVHSGLEGVLAAVRQTAAELLAAAPQPPSTLNVRAGTVAVEMTWDTTPAAPVPDPAGSATSTAPAAANDAGGGVDLLTATTVGVFYKAPSPGAAPFVNEGDQVVPGQQIAIVEAMKLMLPVEADRAGTVVEVLVKDGEPVEYGQPLFRIAPAD